MSAINEFDLIEKQEMRSKFLERIDILETVGELLTLPNTDLMTTKMVAEFYKVSQDAIEKTTQRNRDELVGNGLTFMSYGEIKELIGQDNIIKFGVSRQGSNVFNLDSVMLMAFFITKSNIASEIRKLTLENDSLRSKYEKYIIKKDNSYLKENKLHDVLSIVFKDVCDITREFKLENYYIDFLLDFGDIKIAVECDEFNHCSYNKENEEIRRNIICNHFKLIRYNPDGDSSFLELINKIFLTVKNNS